MRLIVVILVLFLVLMPEFVFCGETVTRVIESDVPMILNGHWLYSPFRVVLTDSTITVNGYLYEGPEEKEEPVPEPTKEKEFLSWLLKTAMDSARAMIDTGKSYDEAVDMVEEFFSKYADGDTLKVEQGKGEYRGAFSIKYYKGSMPVIVNVPRYPRERISYREGWLEPQFKELCRRLENGFLVVTGKGYRYAFQPVNVPKVLEELKKLKDPQYAKERLKEGRVYIRSKNYETRLMRRVIEDLINPRED